MTDDLVTADHRHWLHGQARSLIAFARGSRLGSGGFGWLDEDGRVMPRPLELWINCRMTHVFALAQALGVDDAGDYVEHGVAALHGSFADDEYLGWFATVTADGPEDASKMAYAHAFVILAASSAAARGASGADELLHQALEVSERHFFDQAAGLSVETWDRTWTDLEPYRGANANMHTVEAYLAAADVTGEPVWRDLALGITDRIVNQWARGNDWRVLEHFDSDWRPLLEYNVDRPADPFRPYGSTVGHGMEWARLALHLRAAYGAAAPDWLLATAVALFERAATDGWAADGAPGFLYTVDWNGRPVVRERMHWVAAEATAAAAALYQATGDPAYADRYRQWWDYIAAEVVDPERGSWHHELTPDGTPSATTWAGKPDIYHALQAVLIPLLPLTPVITVSSAALVGALD